jgi:hypothetical protein
MRELNVVGLDVDGKSVICESAESGEKFLLIPDGRLHAALRGDRVGSSKFQREAEDSDVLRPRDIQSRIRAGASPEQVAEAAGVDLARVERFAHPVLLERSRAAELATAAHPVLADGPTVMTLLETVSTVLISRGLDPEDRHAVRRLGRRAGRPQLPPAAAACGGTGARSHRRRSRARTAARGPHACTRSAGASGAAGQARTRTAP